MACIVCPFWTFSYQGSVLCGKRHGIIMGNQGFFSPCDSHPDLSSTERINHYKVSLLGLLSEVEKQEDLTLVSVLCCKVNFVL